MIRFLDTDAKHCRTPISGDPGPDMLVCGQPPVPGKSSCSECRARLYYRPTKTELKTLDWVAKQPPGNRRTKWA